jgi:hypothetical protein
VSFTPDQKIAQVSVYEQVSIDPFSEVPNPTSEDSQDEDGDDSGVYAEDTFEDEPVAAPTRQNLNAKFSKATDSLNHGLTGGELRAAALEGEGEGGKKKQPNMMNAIIQSMATTTAPASKSASSSSSSSAAVSDSNGDAHTATTTNTSSSSSSSDAAASAGGDAPAPSSAASDKLKQLEAFMNSKKLTGKMSMRDRMNQRRLVSRGGWKGGGAKDTNATL